MKTIRVTGKGQLKIPPDMIRLVLNISDTKLTYEDAMAQSTKATDALKNMLSPLDLLPKTARFSIEAEYESYKDRDTFKQRFVGYQFTHTLKVEFAADNALLGRVLYNIALSGTNPELRILYTVRDEEAAKNLLLAKAVEDAKAKASTLATAAGVSLLGIQSIDYSWGEIRFESTPLDRGLAMPTCAEGFALDIDPDDIEVNDTVTVVWEIEG